MLEIVKFGEGEYDFPCLVVLGCFDGLHSGHSELLKKARLQAKINGLDLGVMMFENGKEGKQLYSFDEKLALVENFNVKFVLKIDYNDEFKQIKPLEFLDILEEHLNVKAYMSGKDFRFGQGAKGKSSTLKSFAEDEENGVWYMSVKDVLSDGEKISATTIKTLLSDGEIKKANELLGRNYSVSGIVIHGADRGEKVLGYPTLNIKYPEEKVEVKKGVYTVKCSIGGSDYFGIANYGARPTFGEDSDLLEVYLDGFEGTLYDETVTVEFIGYIRDIQKFESAEELSAQLAKDLLTAKEEAAAAEACDESSECVAETEGDSVAEAHMEEPLETAATEVTEEKAAEEEHIEETVNQPVEIQEPATEQEEEFEAELSETAAEEPMEEILQEKTEEIIIETSEQLNQEEDTKTVESESEEETVSD